MPTTGITERVKRSARGGVNERRSARKNTRARGAQNAQIRGHTGHLRSHRQPPRTSASEPLRHSIRPSGPSMRSFGADNTVGATGTPVDPLVTQSSEVARTVEELEQDREMQEMITALDGMKPALNERTVNYLKNNAANINTLVKNFNDECGTECIKLTWKQKFIRWALNTRIGNYIVMRCYRNYNERLGDIYVRMLDLQTKYA